MVLHHHICNKRLLAFICYAKKKLVTFTVDWRSLGGHKEVNFSPWPFFVMSSVLAFICYAKWDSLATITVLVIRNQRSEEVKNVSPLPCM